MSRRTEGDSRMERRVAERVDVQAEVHWRRLSPAKAESLAGGDDYAGVVSEGDPEGEVPTADFLERRAYTENLSTTGLKLVGDLRLQDGSALRKGWRLMVEIRPGGSAEPIHAVAEVVWVTPPEGPPPRQAGLFFQAIHKRDVQRVLEIQAAAKRERPGHWESPPS